MTKQDYVSQYAKYPRWELLNMKKALSLFGGFLNDETDNLRLEAIKQVLKTKKH